MQLLRRVPLLVLPLVALAATSCSDNDGAAAPEASPLTSDWYTGSWSSPVGPLSVEILVEGDRASVSLVYPPPALWAGIHSERGDGALLRLEANGVPVDENGRFSVLFRDPGGGLDVVFEGGADGDDAGGDVSVVDPGAETPVFKDDAVLTRR